MISSPDVLEEVRSEMLKNYDKYNGALNINFTVMEVKAKNGSRLPDPYGPQIEKETPPHTFTKDDLKNTTKLNDFFNNMIIKVSNGEISVN
jgi:hypothetical protein